MQRDTERELEAVEMAIAGLTQGVSWAPEGSPTSQACDALIVEFRERARALGGPEPLPAPPTLLPGSPDP
jgi:hypothetical protein